MKKYILLISILILAFSCTRKMEDSPSSSSSESSQDVTTTTGSVEGDKGAYTYDRVSGLHWPTPLKDGEVESVEKDLTKTNYYVVFDGSGSMDSSGCSNNESKDTVAKRAVNVFASNIPKDANLGLLTFDNMDIREVVSLGANNREEFSNAVKASVTGNGTPLKDAIAEGVRRLGAQARKQLGYGRYQLVVVTDGAPDYDQSPDQVVKFVVDNTPIELTTIGFCLDESHVLNQVGKTNYKAATSPEELAKGLQDVLAESPTFSVDSFK